MAEIFLSYSRADRPVAQAMATELQRLGVDVWWDHDLLGGDDYRSRINETVLRAAATIVLWSRRAVDSQWVIAEASAAREKRYLVPINLDGAEPPIDFRTLHTIDFTSWVPGDVLPDTLLRGLSDRLKRELSYTSPNAPPGTLSRMTRRATQSWYVDFETMIFYLIAQGFACFLCSLDWAYLSNSSGAFRGSAASWPWWTPYAHGLLIGLILAPLVMRHILSTQRLPSAIPIFAAAALLGVVSFIIADTLYMQMQNGVIVLVGPAMLMFLLTSSLADRVGGK